MTLKTIKKYSPVFNVSFGTHPVFVRPIWVDTKESIQTTRRDIKKNGDKISEKKDSETNPGFF